MTERYYLPALRGRFGDWAYYSTLMPLNQVETRVDYADVIHVKRNLSDMIQRELKAGRAREIADYLLANQDRFFNSLVVAVYGGTPQWHPFDVKPISMDIAVDDLDETSRDSVGYLSLTGEEKLYALDGQHRLAGIKRALATDRSLEDQELSVIFVAHDNSPEGMRRTRKLFTTLNKHAKAVKKSEIIALDESDVIAIVTRRLVEDHPYFNDGQVDILRKQANIAHGDVEHFTTIINLYDTLDLLLLRVHKGLKPEDATKFKAYRPKDEEIDDLLKAVTDLYGNIIVMFPALNQYFKANSDKRRTVLKEVRSDRGGHVLFRPIGMLIFCQILAFIVGSRKAISEAMEMLKSLPTELDAAPYVGTIWDPVSKTVNTKRMTVCRDVLLHMLNHRRGSTEALLERYATALGKQPHEVSLPKSLVRPTSYAGRRSL